MKKWIDHYYSELDIAYITAFEIPAEECLNISIVDTKQQKWVLLFWGVRNFRSVAGDKLSRSKNERNATERDGCVYIIKKAKITNAADKTSHFLVCDKTGAGLEVLTTGGPMLAKVMEPKDEQGNAIEKWHAYKKLNVEIEFIDHFVGGNQELRVFFTDEQRAIEGENTEKYELFFDSVWDFRYSIENGFIGRCPEMDHIGSRAVYTSIYLVENSKYIKYFEQQVSSTRPIDDLKHFIIFDGIDTGIEVLSNAEPILRVHEE